MGFPLFSQKSRLLVQRCSHIQEEIDSALLCTHADSVCLESSVHHLHLKSGEELSLLSVRDTNL